MSLFSRLLGGLPFHPWLVVALFALSLLTLVFSMVVASRLAGGIDFGSPGAVIPRGAVLLTLITCINLVDCGVILAGPVWFFGLMYLFQLDFPQTRLLTRVNWSMNILWKVLLLALSL